MELTKEQRDKLNADLPLSAVKKREGGGNKQLSYVEGWWVIARLNEVFGPCGWSYDCQIVSSEKELGKNKKGDAQWQVSHIVKCVLSVGECRIGDYGAGSGAEASLAAALEKSVKEASTDALKRCAKSLGPSMGLALYDKEQERVAAEVTGPSDEGQRLIDEARAAENGHRREVGAKIRAAWPRLNDFDRDTLKAISESWKGGAA